MFARRAYTTRWKHARTWQYKTRLRLEELARHDMAHDGPSPYQILDWRLYAIAAREAASYDLDIPGSDCEALTLP